MDHLDMVTVAGQKIGQIGDDNRVATEMFRREESRDQAESHAAWVFPNWYC
jgi:hypothetical protein